MSSLASAPLAVLAAGLWVVILLDSVPLLGILIPADVAVLAATSGRSPLGGTAVVLGVVAGYVTGWSASFLLGRYFGDRVRTGRFGRWIGAGRWSRAEELLAAGGWRILFAAPFLPVVNTLVPLVAGGLRISYRRFLPMIAAGSTLWATLYVTLGLCANTVHGLIDGDTLAAVATVLIGSVLGTTAVRSARRLVTPPAPVPVDANAG